MATDSNWLPDYRDNNRSISNAASEKSWLQRTLLREYLVIRNDEMPTVKRGR